MIADPEKSEVITVTVQKNGIAMIMLYAIYKKKTIKHFKKIVL